MNLLLGLAPFIVFALVERLAGPTPGLIAGALASVVSLLRDWMGKRKTPKVLEIGSAVLFGLLAIYRVAMDATWSVLDVRFRVDTGLLLIVLASIVMRRPFTLQYAREEAPQEWWARPEFIRTNYIITAVWAAAFAVIVGADLLMLFMPALPLKVGVGATILAILGAFRFTSWYPDHLQAQATQTALQNNSLAG